MDISRPPRAMLPFKKFRLRTEPFGHSRGNFIRPDNFSIFMVNRPFPVGWRCPFRTLTTGEINLGSGAPNRKSRVSILANSKFCFYRSFTASFVGFPMKRLIQLGLTAATFALLATSANAAVNLDGSAPGFNIAPLGAGEDYVVGFGGPNAPGYTFATDPAPYIYHTADGLHPGIAAPPFGDDSSSYMAIQTDQSIALNTPYLQTLSLFIGSLDPTNKITFNGTGGFTQSFLGSDLFTPAEGNQSSDQNNRRFYFSFNPADGVNQIVFSSGENSFEFDSIAALAGGVPEPGTWAMLLLGFGGIGLMLRNAKRRGFARITA